MYANTSCTLYLASQNYQKIIVSRCFLTHRRMAASSKLGLEYAEKAFVMINGQDTAKRGLYPSESLHPGESVIPFESMLSCRDLVFTEGKDFMVEGNCPFIFDNSSEKGFSDKAICFTDRI